MRRSLTPLLFGALAWAGCAGEDGEQNVAKPIANEAIALPEAPQTLNGVPQDFLGAWNFALEDCNVAASEGRLVIAPERIEYYESVATIESVSGAPRSIIVEAEFTGEGESWTERLAYELNAAGDRLTTTTEDGDVSVRMRC